MNHQWLYPIPGRPRNSGRNPRWGIPTCKALPFTGIIPFLCIQCTPFLVTIVTCWSDFNFNELELKKVVHLCDCLRHWEGVLPHSPSVSVWFVNKWGIWYPCNLLFYWTVLALSRAFLRLCANVTWGSALRHSFILKVYIILQKK